jgi:hypothetical protein
MSVGGIIFNGVDMSKKIKIIPTTKMAESFINISPSSDFVPDWYRTSPSIGKGQKTFLIKDNPMSTTSTYKKCTPFYDALTIGYTVYLSADIEVTNRNNTPWILWRTKDELVTVHDNEQWEGLPVPDGYVPFVYKWHNDLVLKLPKDYSLLFLNPINRFDLPFQTITGIVDCDSYDLSVQFPFFIKKDFYGIIEKGTPITQIIPIKRESWEREVDKYDKEKYDLALRKFFTTIKRSYKNNHWFKKEYK